MNGSGLPLVAVLPVGVVAAVVLPRRLRYLLGVLGVLGAFVSDLVLLALESLRGGRAMHVVVDGVSTGGGGAGASIFEAFLKGGSP